MTDLWLTSGPLTKHERVFLHKLASALAQPYRADAERHLLERQDICDAAQRVLEEERPEADEGDTAEQARADAAQDYT